MCRREFCDERRLGLTFFFFNDTATTEIYTLSLHDALPICLRCLDAAAIPSASTPPSATPTSTPSHARSAPSHAPAAAANFTSPDRKSTRLNSSHANISYAVFCLKKKNNLHLHSFPVTNSFA